MPVFDWFSHYRNRFGLKWHIIEIPYRIVDLEVPADFETILGVGSERALFETLPSKNRSVIASDVSPALMRLAEKHGKNI